MPSHLCERGVNDCWSLITVRLDVRGCVRLPTDHCFAPLCPQRAARKGAPRSVCSAAAIVLFFDGPYFAAPMLASKAASALLTCRSLWRKI
jgi:hypothetical protein